MRYLRCMAILLLAANLSGCIVIPVFQVGENAISDMKTGSSSWPEEMKNWSLSDLANLNSNSDNVKRAFAYNEIGMRFENGTYGLPQNYDCAYLFYSRSNTSYVALNDMWGHKFEPAQRNITRLEKKGYQGIGGLQNATVQQCEALLKAAS